MRIAQVSPLIESVPPKLYGGTERIVSYLTEELVRQGHEITLFASGDSSTSARLVACAPKALRLAQARDHLPYCVLQLELVRRRASEFDIIHFHGDYLHFPLMRRFPYPSVTTMHGRLDLPDLLPIFAEFVDMPLVSISAQQRLQLRANWIGTVHHGLPRDLYGFSAKAEGDYVAFIGRICPEKRPDRAIEIARRAGLRLKIAAKIDKADQRYFEDAIRPLLRDPLVEFVGEIGEKEKGPFLKGAKALLFPIDWPEPFGLVMIEAMACGTPVIAWPCGSVHEVVEHGLTGFVVNTMDEAVGALKNIASLSRVVVRRRFEARFAVEIMAHNYLRIYSSLVELGRSVPTERDASVSNALRGTLQAGQTMPLRRRPRSTESEEQLVDDGTCS
jgi:glycosyltransferase involved in cell wall biosynthesis